MWLGFEQMVWQNILSGEQKHAWRLSGRKNLGLLKNWTKSYYCSSTFSLLYPPVLTLVPEFTIIHWTKDSYLVAFQQMTESLVRFCVRFYYLVLICKFLKYLMMFLRYFSRYLSWYSFLFGLMSVCVGMLLLTIG